MFTNPQQTQHFPKFTGKNVMDQQKTQKKHQILEKTFAQSNSENEQHLIYAENIKNPQPTNPRMFQSKSGFWFEKKPTPAVEDISCDVVKLRFVSNQITE